MKATGIVKKMDNNGTIKIPKDLREVLNINDGQFVEFFTSYDPELGREVLIAAPLPPQPKLNYRMREFLTMAEGLRYDLESDFNKVRYPDEEVLEALDEIWTYLADNYDWKE